MQIPGIKAFFGPDGALRINANGTLYVQTRAADGFVFNEDGGVEFTLAHGQAGSVESAAHFPTGTKMEEVTKVQAEEQVERYDDRLLNFLNTPFKSTRTQFPPKEKKTNE